MKSLDVTKIKEVLIEAGIPKNKIFISNRFNMTKKFKTLCIGKFEKIDPELLLKISEHAEYIEESDFSEDNIIEKCFLYYIN